MTLRPFHLAIPVKDLGETRSFYRHVLGFNEGRSAEKWVDFNCYGHQLVLHQVSENPSVETNPVDGHEVPVPHFGVVLLKQDWDALAKRLKEMDVDFIIEPYVRFEGQVGEQATMFFLDPSGNALEFKSFQSDKLLFDRS